MFANTGRGGRARPSCGNGGQVQGDARVDGVLPPARQGNACVPCGCGARIRRPEGWQPNAQWPVDFPAAEMAPTADHADHADLKHLIDARWVACQPGDAGPPTSALSAPAECTASLVAAARPRRPLAIPAARDVRGRHPAPSCGRSQKLVPPR